MDDSHLREAPLRRSEIHRGRLLTVFDDEVTLPDGRTAHREMVQHPGAVTIVAVDAERRVVLVRQWRHAAGRALWELPAGTLDRPGEEPLAAARRELAEETGVTAQTWRFLARAPLAPGYSSEEMHFFAAETLTLGRAGPDPDERLDVEWFTPAAVRAVLGRSELDVKTVAGLTLAGWELGHG